MTPDEARIKAENNFHDGYNCTQAVVCVFAEQFGYDEKTVMKMVQTLGGGMCRMREVCGTVTGMLLTLGMAEGSSDPSDKNAKDSIYAHGQEVAASFRKEHGSIICKELLGLVPLGTSEAQLKKPDDGNTKNDANNMTSPVSEERTESYYKRRPCQKLCGDAAYIIAEYLKNKE